MRSTVNAFFVPRIRSSRFLSLQLRDPMFRFVVKLAQGADTFKSSSLNALLRLLPLSGLALVHFLRECRLVDEDFVDACRQVYHARATNPTDAGVTEFVVDLQKRDNYTVQDAIRSFMNIDDDESSRALKILNFPDVSFPIRCNTSRC